MKKVTRMNEKPETATRLVAAAVELFSQNGYDATSVRAITAFAGANLGAITYHFGSKEALYDAALGLVTEPILELAAETAKSVGPPLIRVERLVRVFFQYLTEHPEFPNMISHQLAGSRQLPAPAREAMQKNIRTLMSLIAEGQQDGTIRGGNPRDMALSIVAQPMWLTLARRALLEGAGLDQEDPETREQLVESVVQFVRAGLRTQREDQS
jgi:AcrR family transcriptional regulator